MQVWIIYMIGFAAQLLFSGRLMLQWLLSERQKRVLAPKLFWQFSLLGSFLLFIYGYLRNDFAIMLGQGITYFIYIRNLQLQQEWRKIPAWLRILLWIFPALMVVYYYHNKISDLHNLFIENGIPAWLMVLGIIAQVIFNLRFIYQWLYSEKRKESLLPMGFWILSFAGAVLILIYAVFRKDPVLLIGHLMGSIVYVRNILIIHRSHEEFAEAK